MASTDDGQVFYNGNGQSFVYSDAVNGTAATGSSSGTSGSGSSTDPSQQGAYDILKQTLASWGLGDLYNYAVGYLQQGMTTDEITIELQQTPEYKARFSGNALRQAKGLGTLSPAQYIAMEDSYRQIMQSYGLPANFYDSHDDYAAMIGADLSAAEVQTRAQIAHDQYEYAPQATKDLWGQYFGTKGDAIAMILDPNTATSVIQDRANQVGIGGAAAQFGFGINQGRAQLFDQSGVTLDGARKAYQQIAQTMPIDQAIAKRFGTIFTQGDEENDLLLGAADATNKRTALYGEESALFQGHGGADANAISVSQSY